MAAPKNEKSVLLAHTIDFETGGLKCQTCACTQIAVHTTRLDTFERVGSFVRYIRPYNKKDIKGTGTKRKTLKSKFDDQQESMEYQEKALTYSAITMNMLYEKGEPIEDVARELIEYLQDVTPKCKKNELPFFIGQNIPFDEGFLIQLMEYGDQLKELQKLVRGHEDFYGHWHPLYLDTITLGQLALCHMEHIDSYKLEIMCENLGIELDDAHDADADVSATTNVAAVLTQRMRSVGGVSTGGSLTMAKAEKSRKHFKI